MGDIKKELKGVDSKIWQMRDHVRKSQEYPLENGLAKRWAKENGQFAKDAAASLAGLNDHEGVRAAREELTAAQSEIIAALEDYAIRCGEDVVDIRRYFPES